jgi:hypothetical protein
MIALPAVLLLVNAQVTECDALAGPTVKAVMAEALWTRLMDIR